MFDFLALLLDFFYSLWPGPSQFGMSIVMLTIVVLLVVMPLTFKQTKSMIAMQQLQPQIKQLQVQHKDDRERLNQEMMALYQEHGVNPLGGCLPLLVQLPVFLVLFNIIRGITRRSTQTGLSFGSAGLVDGDRVLQGEVGGFSTLEPVTDFPSRDFNPAYLDPDSEMYAALIDRNDMPSFGFDLARSASQAISDSLSTALPYLLLILIVFVTSLVQQRQISGRRDPSAAANPTQQMLMKVMPFFLPIFSYGFAAAVVVYFVVSNLFRVGQQSLITRQFYGEHGPATIVPAKTSGAQKSGAKTKAGPARNTSSDKSPAKTGSAAARVDKKTTVKTGGGQHGSRRPTSRAPRKRRTTDTAAQPQAERVKPTKPQKKSSGRITPKKSDGRSRRNEGK
ncbi:MAG: membrane protein insertase YidC [Acidimicrobiia bacterium]|nr:membrane protein insertase YidC [Acidimicrobiia bacterium]